MRTIAWNTRITRVLHALLSVLGVINYLYIIIMQSVYLIAQSAHNVEGCMLGLT